MKYQGGLSGSRASTEPYGLGPPGFDPGRKDFTIADVLAWARTKPAGERYDYFDTCGCVCGQFAGFAGIDCRGRESSGYLARWRFEGKYAEELQAHPHTFGAFVKRLEKLCPETPVTKSDWLAIDAYMADIESVSA